MLLEKPWIVSGTEVCLLPCPDITPSDFALFGSLKIEMEGMHFEGNAVFLNGMHPTKKTLGKGE